MPRVLDGGAGQREGSVEGAVVGPIAGGADAAIGVDPAATFCKQGGALRVAAPGVVDGDTPGRAAGVAVVVVGDQRCIYRRHVSSEQRHTPCGIASAICADSSSVIWRKLGSDRAFVFMLKRLKPMAMGEVIIGNFSSAYPDRPYMRLMDWQLVYRSPQRLLALARAAGFDAKKAWVGREETGVNLFLHLAA